MKKIILILTIPLLMVNFSSCKKNITLSFSDEIIVDLGSTDQDVLKFVTASDGSTVSVSEIDYNLVGEQTAIFTTGEVNETKSVKIKSDKLTGTYIISIYVIDNNEEVELSTGEGWLMNITKGNKYNQINIPDSIETGFNIFPEQGKLVVTFNGNDSAYIPGYHGLFPFSTSGVADYSFCNIKYGYIGNGIYALKEFILKETIPDYEYYYRIKFEKK